MKKKLMRYRAFLLVFVFIAVLTVVNYKLGLKALTISVNSFKEMIFVIPPVFVLLGLLDIWVPRETMVKFMERDPALRELFYPFCLGQPPPDHCMVHFLLQQFL